MRAPILVAIAFASLFGCASEPKCKKNCEPAAPLVFFDIAGPDMEALRTFYTAAFGWNMDASGTIDKASTGGLPGSLRKDPAGKTLYIGVPDVTKALQAVVAAGGTVLAARFEVKGVVILGLFKDPAGNVMGVIETQDGKIKIP